MIYQDILHRRALARYTADLNARARQSGAQGSLSVADLRDRIVASGGNCEWCGESLVRGPFELDHIVSLKQGGSNTRGNLVIACPDCNRRKGQKHPARFAAEIVSASGRRTALVDKVLSHFAIEAREQRSLFADGKLRPEKSLTPGTVDQPRYRW